MHDTNSSKTAIEQGAADNEHDTQCVLERSGCKVKGMADAEIWVSKDSNSRRAIVNVKITGVLDLRAVDLMQRVNSLARRFKAACIIVDLGKTSRLHDSGLASLLLLKEKLAPKIKLIRLVNTGHLTNKCLAYLPETFVIN